MDIFHGQGIFLADVDVSLVGADGIGPQGQSFQDRVGIALQETAVHVGAGVTLVGVDDHVLGIVGGVARALPFAAGGESAATAASQIGLLDFVEDFLVGHAVERLGQGRIPADGQVVVDAFGVDAAVGAEDQA